MDGQVRPVAPCLERGVNGRVPVGLGSSRSSNMALKWRSMSSVVEQAEESKSTGPKPLEGFSMFGHHLRYRSAHGPQLPSRRGVHQISTVKVTSVMQL